MKLCRICLSRNDDGRLYSISNSRLCSPFQLLTGMQVSKHRILVDIDKRLPQWVCAECGLRLMSFDKLREKSLRSHQILTALLSRFDSIIDDDISWSPVTIETRLSRTGIVINQYDPNIEEDSGFLNNDASSLHTELKLEDTSTCSNTIQGNKPADSQDDFEASLNNEGDSTSNDEEMSLSMLLKAKEIKPKITKEITKHKNINKSNQKQRKQLEKVNHRQKNPETINHKEINKRENETRKRLKNKEDRQGTDKRLKEFPFETMFTISKMSTEELRTEVLNRKMSSNYLNAAFKCTDCFKGFCDEETFDRHKLKHSKDWGSVECDICKYKYPCKSTLGRHFARMHSVRYTCRKCSFVTSSRGYATRHGNKHMGLKFKCKNCELEFVNYTTYLNHLRKSHTSEFICELCGHSFISALGVLQHKKIIHRDAVYLVLEGPQCTTCDIKFASEEAYAKHLKFSAKHVSKTYDVKKKRPNQGIKQPTFCEQVHRKCCPQCEECTRNTLHLRINHKTGNVALNKCNLKLDSQLAYFKHFKSAHPDKKRTQVQYSYSFMCEECGGIFRSNVALEEHKRIHRKEKPFACARCGRAFTQRIALKMHETIHDENRTLYPCQLCEKKFTNRNNLKRHTFLHTGVRPFDCENCGKSFKTKSEKQTHYDYVHLKKPWPKRDRHRRVVGGKSGTDIQ